MKVDDLGEEESSGTELQNAASLGESFPQTVDVKHFSLEIQRK
jgi:hypothetical protein